MKLDNYVDIKVFILYLMKNVGEPLEFTTVNDIVLQDEFVGYFDFAFCFSDLLDAGAIVSEESGGKTLYSVSALGLETLESYEGSLLPVIKERALRSALRLIAFKRSGSRITTDINEVAGGICSSVGSRTRNERCFPPKSSLPPISRNVRRSSSAGCFHCFPGM